MAGSWYVVAVRHTLPALPMHLPAPGPAEEVEEDESNDVEDVEERDDDVQRMRESSESNIAESEAECSDSDWFWMFVSENMKTCFEYEISISYVIVLFV